MIFAESVTQAFEAIRAAFCFDAFTPVPHPDNIRFRADEERKVLHRLGLMLTFEEIREAVKRAALDCCNTNQTFSEFALMKSLYAAAK